MAVDRSSSDDDTTTVVLPVLWTTSSFQITRPEPETLAAFFFSRRDYSSPKRDDLDEFNLVWRQRTAQAILVCLHWCCYSRHVNVNRLELLEEANRSPCPKKKNWKQWLWEWPLLVWKLLNWIAAAVAVATTVPSAWRTLQRWFCLGLDSVSNQLVPRLGPFIFGSVCRERDHCANMLNIQI